MASMILAKKAIFSISKSFPQTQSLFLRSSSSSTHKFSRATFTTTTYAKEKLAETTRERKTEMFKKAKQKAAEVKDRTKGSAQNVKKKTCKNKAEETKERKTDTSGSAAAAAADKAKEGTYKGSESAQNVKEKQKLWKKPPDGWHNLSVDGSAREDIGGIGGLIRDKNGSIVAAFAAGIPTAPIPLLEIKAIVEGVKMAITNRVTKLIINSDSTQAVEVIDGRLDTPSKARDDIILLNSMKGSFTRFEVRHVCRKANKPADFLASFCKDESTFFFNSVNSPPQLTALAAQDASTGCN